MKHALDGVVFAASHELLATGRRRNFHRRHDWSRVSDSLLVGLWTNPAVICVVISQGREGRIAHRNSPGYVFFADFCAA